MGHGAQLNPSLAERMKPGPSSDPVDEILCRYETLQRVRIAAAQAAEIAKVDAAELARLQSSVPPATTEAQTEEQQHNNDNDDGNGDVDVLHPKSEPPSEIVVDIEAQRQRAERIMNLGQYWASRKMSSRPPPLPSEHEEEDDEKEALRRISELAQRVGGYEQLAKRLKQSIVHKSNE